MNIPTTSHLHRKAPSNSSELSIALEEEKRKIEEDVDDSESSEEEESTDGEEDGNWDEEESDEDEEVEVLDNEGKSITDDELLEWMKEDRRPIEEKKRLLNKIRKYLKSIRDSDGFECSHFPGYIWGLTITRPIQGVITKRDKHPEGYNHILYLSSLAIGDYNNKHCTRFAVNDVKKVSFSNCTGEMFYITFGAQDLITGEMEVFQSAVWDNIAIDKKIQVEECRRKPKKKE